MIILETDAIECKKELECSFSNQETIIISEHVVKISLLSFQKVIVNETISFINNQSSPLSSLDLWNNHTDRNGMIIEDDLGVLSHEATENLLRINLRSSISSGELGSIYLNYVLEDHFQQVVSESFDYYRFEFISTISYSTLVYEVDVRYVSSLHLYDRPEVLPYFPSTNPPIWSGGYYNIGWKFNNPKIFSIDYLIYLCFKSPKGNLKVRGYVLGALGFLGLGSFVTLWIMRKRQSKIMKKLDDIYLTDDQKLLLKLIAEKGGRTTQKELVNLTGFTKSKVSRNLNPLEQGGFVRKERWGNQYRVYLTDLGKKVIE